MEDISGEMVSNHWPEADSGGAYKKGRPDRYWRANQTAPDDPDGEIDGFLKQNNSAANDWSDLTGFFSTWQAACAPHFPGSNPLDVANSGGSSTSGNGNWDGTAFSAGEIASVDTVADLDQWARWFAIMTVLADNETNVSNGQDDDYGVYFEPRTVGQTQQRRLQFIPHDLDTIFRTCNRVGVIIDRQMTSDSLEGIARNPHPWIQAYFHGERAQRFGTHGT